MRRLILLLTTGRRMFGPEGIVVKWLLAVCSGETIRRAVGRCRLEEVMVKKIRYPLYLA
jgi:hypothetical protein